MIKIKNKEFTSVSLIGLTEYGGGYQTCIYDKIQHDSASECGVTVDLGQSRGNRRPYNPSMI